MEPIVVATHICPDCGSPWEAGRQTCPSCSSSAVPRCDSAAVVAAPAPVLQELLDNRKVLLLVLFGVTAAMGIPFLWRSRAFSRWGKIALTIVVCLYTLVILEIFWLVLRWSLGSIRESLGW